MADEIDAEIQDGDLASHGQHGEDVQTLDNLAVISQQPDNLMVVDEPELGLELGAKNEEDRAESERKERQKVGAAQGVDHRPVNRSWVRRVEREQCKTVPNSPVATGG